MPPTVISDYVTSGISATKSFDLNAVNIGSIATVAAPSSGKTLTLISGSISVSAACSVLFEDNAAGGGVVFRTPVLGANSPFNWDLAGPVTLAGPDRVLKATASAPATITGTIRGNDR